MIPLPTRHGTRYRYERAGCRCPLCTAGHTLRMRLYRHALHERRMTPFERRLREYRQRRPRRHAA